MLTQSTRSLLSVSAQQKTIPIIENRLQLARALDAAQITAILVRHCSLFDLRPLLDQAYVREVVIYVNVDHIDGIHPDTAGLRYLAHQLHIAGIISANPRILALGKENGLEVIQRIFAVDSAGLEVALDSVDSHIVDLLVIPYIVPQHSLPLPFMGSGLIHTYQQVQAVLRAGAFCVAVVRPELWM